MEGHLTTLKCNYIHWPTNALLISLKIVEHNATDSIILFIHINRGIALAEIDPKRPCYASVNEKNSKGTLLKTRVTVSLNGDITGIGIGNTDSITKLIKSTGILNYYTGYSDTMHKSGVNVGA